MAEQHPNYNPREDVMPRYLNKPDAFAPTPPPHPAIEEYLSQTMIDYIWPVASWVIVISNSYIAFIAIVNMWQNGYNAFTHGALTVLFCTTLALIAAIYKKILKGR